MKNVLIYLAGFISGIVFLIVISLFVNDASADNGVEGLTVFEQPADVIPSYSFEVFQVVQNGNALAHMGERKSYGYDSYGGLVVLLLADENTHYYDDQIVNVPKGKCAMQIGTYKYETKEGIKLGKWIHNQRTKYKNTFIEERIKKVGYLTQEQIDLLNDIGMT